MNKVPLNDFVNEKGQTEAGRLLGVTQGAIWRALKKEREIYVIENEDGSYSAEELRPFPAQPSDINPQAANA